MATAASPNRLGLIMDPGKVQSKNNLGSFGQREIDELRCRRQVRLISNQSSAQGVSESQWTGRGGALGVWDLAGQSGPAGCKEKSSCVRWLQEMD